MSRVGERALELIVVSYRDNDWHPVLFFGRLYSS